VRANNARKRHVILAIVQKGSLLADVAFIARIEAKRLASSFVVHLDRGLNLREFLRFVGCNRFISKPLSAKWPDVYLKISSLGSVTTALPLRFNNDGIIRRVDLPIPVGAITDR
jgi:hypothetical protein